MHTAIKQVAPSLGRPTAVPLPHREARVVYMDMPVGKLRGC